jgi:hypothetical protein
MNAARNASGRAGTAFDRTPLTTAFADAEIRLIATLRDLVATDEQTRAFVTRWRTLVETTDEYPQRRGAVFARTDTATFTIGAQLLRAAVTLWDALVSDETVMTGYRILGTVVED